jgi:hypothetical protein
LRQTPSSSSIEERGEERGERHIHEEKGLSNVKKYLLSGLVLESGERTEEGRKEGGKECKGERREESHSLVEGMEV